MRHNCANKVHAPLTAENWIPSGNIDRQAVSVLKTWRDVRSVAVAALKAKVASPSLSFQCFCDVIDDLRCVKQRKVIDAVLGCVEFHRLPESPQTCRNQPGTRQIVIVSARSDFMNCCGGSEFRFLMSQKSARLFARDTNKNPHRLRMSFSTAACKEC